MKVVFIAGTGRCGSTLLDLALSQLPNTTSVGELRYFWSRGICQNRVCGSGVPFLEDDNWKTIVKQLYGESYMEDAADFSALEKRNRIRHMLGIKSSNKVANLQKLVNPYSDELARVLKEISKQFGTDIIIDSSKMPLHGLALSQIKGIDLKIIHLVRDRNAVVHSWDNSKYDKGKGGMMKTQSIKKAAIEWVLINRWIERYLGSGTLPYLKLNYSDFTSNPVSKMKEILSFIDEDVTNNPINKNKSFVATATASISGNPMRFSEGPTFIKDDVRWKTDMSYKKQVSSFLYSKLANSLFFI
jgi:hypothetical protein